VSRRAPPTRLLPSAAVVALALTSSGCIKQMLLDGQIEGTRQGSAALDTVGDLQVARGAAEGGLAQIEGMHLLSPNNEDALFMLAKSWTGYGSAFIETDWEKALDDKDVGMADYQMRRGKMAYDRAVFYGLELLGHRDGGFEAARKDDKSIHAWLAANFTDKKDAENLFWVGYAWMARANILKSDFDLGAAYIGELYVGVAMVEQAVALDRSVEHYLGLVVLASYHSRMAMAELDQSKALFDEALEKTQHKNLMVQFNYATHYACVKKDRGLYEKMLTEVLETPDPDPQQRLTNALAKQKAQDALAPHHLKDCGLDLQPTTIKPKAPPADVED
jgi:hypothetical protein